MNKKEALELVKIATHNIQHENPVDINEIYSLITKEAKKGNKKCNVRAISENDISILRSNGFNVDCIEGNYFGGDRIFDSWQISWYL